MPSTVEVEVCVVILATELSFGNDFWFMNQRQLFPNSTWRPSGISVYVLPLVRKFLFRKGFFLLLKSKNISQDKDLSFFLHKMTQIQEVNMELSKQSMQINIETMKQFKNVQSNTITHFTTIINVPKQADEVGEKCIDRLVFAVNSNKFLAIHEPLNKEALIKWYETIKHNLTVSTWDVKEWLLKLFTYPEVISSMLHDYCIFYDFSFNFFRTYLSGRYQEYYSSVIIYS